MSPMSDPEAAGGGPIAVIGIGCRFAGGVDGPEALWRLLAEGRDGIVEVPAGRWDAETWYHPDRDHPGTMNMRQAGFLSGGIDMFDAGFFGIAPREAANMDPQQRLFMEVTHEALEDAGVLPDRLAGSRTGIFAAAYHANYSLMARGAPDPSLIDGWSATGGHASVLAGRIAYYLGVVGPAMVVDTACSSSLVAVHLAVQSLRSGESHMALAGGAHLMSAPEPLVASTKLGATAPDGRCKPFDAAADGFGHGEGAGVIVLKRLADAQAANDRVIAVIRGSAVNQDGRSNSLTAPNGPSQERVIASALSDAGVSPAQVAYVEAHGTGTPLGDPIEVEALAQALGQMGGQDSNRTLLIGSVKANLGHTEAAAGIAGLIKSILILEKGFVPPQAGFNTLNPEIADLETGISVPTSLTPLAPVDGRAIAGVSAFGFAGTNAHVVLESAPALAAAEAERQCGIVTVSARSAVALETAIDRWVAFLETTGEAVCDVARTSTKGRRHFPHRVAVTANDVAAAADALRSAERCEASAPPRVAFLFTGQGSQYPGMAQRLYETQPVFREALVRGLAVLDDAMGLDARAILFGSDPIDRTDLAQPLLVAVELALAAFWRAAGIEPVAAMGHSVGEFAAAAVSGAISEEDALRLVAARGRAMQALPPGGGMLAVFAAPDVISPVLDEVGGVLSVAAINGPSSTVVSGDLDALDRLQAKLAAAGTDCRPLAVSHAFHSPRIESSLDELAVAAERYGQGRPSLPLISNLTGAPVDRLDVQYWRDHALSPVRFAEGIASLQALQADLFLEIGPDGVLTSLAGLSAPDTRRVASLRRGRDDDTVIAEATTALYLAGAELDWSTVQPGRGRRMVRAPLTVFERSRHWLDLPASAPAKARPNTDRRDMPARMNGEDREGSAVIYDFYDELTVLSHNYADSGDASTAEEGHLTFGLLPQPEAGFSWVRALFEKDSDPEGHRRLRQTQKALKDALFDEVDFSRIGTIFDYGCGHAADLASMVLEYPHLTGHGYTVSAGQVEVGRRRLAALGLDDRITVERADSSKTPFARKSDLIFGVEVTGLIADKEGLFGNISSSLTEGGLLVIADFVATGDSIVNPETHSYTPNVGDWAELLGRHGLRLVRVVDTSDEVANWLDDADFESNIDALVGKYSLSELTKRHLLSNGNIGRALRGGLMRYVLLRAIASPHETVEAVTAANLAALENPQFLQSRSPRPDSADWLYRIESRPARIRPVIDPARLCKAADEARAQESGILSKFTGIGEAMDVLSRRYVIAAFRSMGATGLDTVSALEVVPEQRRLVDHLVLQLREAGLERLDDPGDLPAHHRSVLSAFPEAAAELALLERCGPKLADVFAGRADPLDLLFPEGDTALAEALYERSPFSAAVQRMAGAVASSMPRDHPLRVIETGGGTGATTAHVHGALPAGSSYLFTDIGAALVARAQERFAGKDIETARFDVERPPSAQDISAGGFDMAVAANVLHATRDLAGTLANVRDLLAPGGLLMMVENTGQFLWGDITFGLTPGMWAFQESEDRRHALLPQQQWRRYLAEAGFDCLEIADPGHAGLTGISQQCLILARRRPGRRIGIIGNGYEKFSRLLKERGHDLVPLVEGEDFPAGMTDLVYFEGGATGRPAEEILTSVHRAVRQAAAGTAVPRITLIGHGGEDTAVLAGFGRGVAVELPDTLCRVIEADPVISVADQGAGLASAFLETDGDIRLSKGAAGALQLTPEPMTAHNVPELDPNGSYLVTGAFGGLGPHLVRWLQKRGARRFVLAGRREPSPAVRSALAGIDVQFEIADIGDPAAVRKLVDAATAIAPLKGIFHATGALADGALINQTEDDLVVPLRSKLAGAQALDRATREIALDHFVLFSSAAGLLAPFGQANHAAANTALDALAIRRRAEGLPALSVDWGAFAEAGAAMQPGIEEKVSETGLGFMPPEAAFDALGHAMTLDMAQVAIIDADWRRYSKRYPAGGIPFLLQNVCEGRSDAPRIAKAETAAPASARREWRTVLGDAPASHRFDRLCDLIRCEAAAILRVPEGALDEDKPLREAGLDSLMSIELRNTLSNAVSSRLGATLVFDHPSLRALAGHLGETAFPDLFDVASRRRNGVNPETREEDEPDLDSLDAESLSALLAAELGEQARRG